MAYLLALAHSLTFLATIYSMIQSEMAITLLIYCLGVTLAVGAGN